MSEWELHLGRVVAKMGALSSLLTCFPWQTLFANKDKKAKGDTLFKQQQQRVVEDNRGSSSEDTLALLGWLTRSVYVQMDSLRFQGHRALLLPGAAR